MPAYFELEVELAEVRPRIWRRFLLPKNATFLDLHRAIQDACGWSDYHMFDFFAKRPYGESLAGIPDDSGMTEHEIPDASRRELLSYFGTGKGKKKVCGYMYDFGDDWRHKIKLKKIVKLEDDLPRVLLAGARAFPPEDSGGIWGYETCVEVATGQAKADPSDPRSAEQIESRRAWLGDWDPEKFDLEAVKEKFDKGRGTSMSIGVFRRLPDGT
ncbi:MAG: plasmid pRiA4b ORF-3 family protein [Planctomycetota bacterium]